MARYEIGRERPSVAREAAVEYGPAVAPPQPVQGVYHVAVTDRGRLVLPVDLRERLNIHDGDRVAVSVQEDGTIEIETRAVAIRKMRGMFRHLNRPGQALASDRLIAERRRQAMMEDREFRERRPGRRRMKRR